MSAETQKGYDFEVPRFVHDPSSHLYYADEFSDAPEVTVLVTGSPEGPGEFATSVFTPLKAVVDITPHPLMQIYMGKNPLHMRNKASSFLRNGLTLAHEDATNHLVAFSSGPVALQDIMDPRIVSLTLISPLIGYDGVHPDQRNKAGVVGRILGLPNTENHRESILPLIHHTSSQHGVRVFLGEDDAWVDNERVEMQFADISNVQIIRTPREHAPHHEELVEIFTPPSMRA